MTFPWRRMRMYTAVASGLDCGRRWILLPADGNYDRYQVILEERKSNWKRDSFVADDVTTRISTIWESWKRELHPEAMAIVDSFFHRPAVRFSSPTGRSFYHQCKRVGRWWHLASEKPSRRTKIASSWFHSRQPLDGVNDSAEAIRKEEETRGKFKLLLLLLFHNLTKRWLKFIGKGAITNNHDGIQR